MFYNACITIYYTVLISLIYYSIARHEPQHGTQGSDQQVLLITPFNSSHLAFNFT